MVGSGVLISAPLTRGLDFQGETIENGPMVIPGRVHNGVVVLEGGHALLEGMAVTVSCDVAPVSRKPAKRKRVQFPLVHSENPGSLHLTNERIADILDEEDA